MIICVVYPNTGMSRKERTNPIARRDVLAGIGAAGVVGLAGCAGNGEENGEEEVEVIRWHAGGTGGTYFPLSGEIESVIENNTDFNVEVSATGASAENAGSLGAGDADFALMQNDVAFFARNGEEGFEDNQIENLRGVATLYPETIHIITNPESEIESIADLEGAAINTGDLGSGTQVNALEILESVAGLTPNDFDEQNTDFTQAADQIRDGDIDAAFITGGWPVGAVEELATTADIDILNLDDDARETIGDAQPFFADDTIPAGTYEGIGDDVNTVAVQAMIGTREEYSADTVESVTEALFENLGDLTIKADFISVDTAQDGMSIDLHEGAARYFD